ncbi:hypothetical protein [Metapseudomonas otitidis]|uniref:hypothetical protein n=1 Tax=Metapseudomonas otitidis TaxID=319939 RepID=UPI0008E28249|nr:hypothetical protein [Pseudomonas otitidis]SFA66533.1 hypothetical protein SAMN05216263_12227 [Pseudomonas otitidis]
MRVEIIDTARRSASKLRQGLAAQGRPLVELEAGFYSSFGGLLAKLQDLRGEYEEAPAVLITDCHPANLDGIKRLVGVDRAGLEDVTVYAMVEVAHG